jgi:hypothetical protein
MSGSQDWRASDKSSRYESLCVIALTTDDIGTISIRNHGRRVRIPESAGQSELELDHDGGKDNSRRGGNCCGTVTCIELESCTLGLCAYDSRSDGA